MDWNYFIPTHVDDLEAVKKEGTMDTKQRIIMRNFFKKERIVW
jgi:hypothetical protein